MIRITYALADPVRMIGHSADQRATCLAHLTDHAFAHVFLNANIAQSAGNGPCAAVVHDCGNMLKQPIVRAIFDEEDIWIIFDQPIARMAPASRDGGSYG
jgi:hypothetical protein